MTTHIAVCLYGQPRTWKYCLPYILKFYSVPGVRVDYFVSVKTYQMSGEYGDLSVTEITKNEILDIVQSYNPQKYSVIEYSDDLENHDQIHNYSNIYHTMIDSIMLKQQYEAETSIFYDFVFLQRFDTIVHPVNLVETFFNTDKSQVGKNNNTLYYLSDSGTITSIFAPKGINEIWLGGSSVVMDILGVELLNYSAKLATENMRSNKKITPIYSDPHSLFYQLSLKNTINLEQWHKVVNNTGIKSSIIRSNSDLSLDVFDSTSIDKHYQFYINVNYNRKLKDE